MPKLIRMVWDCPACGKRGIISTSRRCACGYVFGTDPADRFRMPEEGEQIITVEHAEDPDELIENWRCDFCGAYNRFSDLVCTTCGHPRDESASGYFTVTGKEKSGRSEQMAEDDVYAGSENIYENLNLTSEEISAAVHKKDDPGTFEQIAEESRRKEAARKAEAKEKTPKEPSDGLKRRSGGAGRLILILAAALVLLGFIGYHFLVPKQTNVKAISKDWERSIDIEEIRTFSESSWSLPYEARLIRTSTEVRTYRQEIDHYEDVLVTRYRQVPHTEVYYEDLGNGNAEERTRTYYTEEPYTVTERQPVFRNVPVYDTKYFYEIDRYVYSRSAVTSGTGKPYWSDLNLTEKEREAGRSEMYRILFEDSDGTHAVEVPFEYWNSVAIGDSIPLEKAIVGEYEYAG